MDAYTQRCQSGKALAGGLAHSMAPLRGCQTEPAGGEHDALPGRLAAAHKALWSDSMLQTEEAASAAAPLGNLNGNGTKGWDEVSLSLLIIFVV